MCLFIFSYFICFQIAAKEMTRSGARETVQLLQQETPDRLLCDRLVKLIECQITMLIRLDAGV